MKNELIILVKTRKVKTFLIEFQKSMSFGQLEVFGVLVLTNEI